MPEPVRLNWGKTTIVIGVGCFDKIAADIRPRIEHAPGPITVFSGRKAMRELGFLDNLVSQFSPRKIEIFEGIGSDPTVNSCQLAVDFLRKVRPACIIALGGGSVIDTAKVAQITAATQNSVGDLLHNTAAKPQYNLADTFIAVPTTAGTGSEVTPFATVWDFAAPKKYSIDNSLLLPTHAYIDARLSVSLSESQTQATAGDALAHAMESVWSKPNQFFTQALAGQAIRLIVKTLPLVLKDPSCVDARQRMAWASLLAGMAISYTRTAAAHAISYPITLNYRVPHGRAVANLLPHVLKENLASLGEEQVDLLCDCFSTGRKDLVQACKTFLAQTGILQPWRDFGVQESDIASLARQSNTPGRLDNNIQKLSVGDIERVITAAL
jgi:phosphonate metabolism-associated iron-containing alcohol dehydrogenase